MKNIAVWTEYTEALGQCILTAISLVRPSVRVFPHCLLNQVTFDLDNGMCTGQDHSSWGIESQGYGQR